MSEEYHLAEEDGWSPLSYYDLQNTIDMKSALQKSLKKKKCDFNFFYEILLC